MLPVSVEVGDWDEVFKSGVPEVWDMAEGFESGVVDGGGGVEGEGDLPDGQPKPGDKFVNL